MKLFALHLSIISLNFNNVSRRSPFLELGGMWHLSHRKVCHLELYGQNAHLKTGCLTILVQMRYRHVV